jgi:protein-L-isoaspartate(D-aspartate) O-methyltransferase
MDYADARKRMVDSQLRPNKVTDPRLLDAMRTLPREEFMPRAAQPRAYGDEDVPLPAGRCMLAPMAIARLIQLAAIRPADRCLVLAAGTGYGAAVIAELGAQVLAVEPEAVLLDLARAALARCRPAGAVRLEQADPRGGFPAGAPFDAILIEGEVPEVPEPIIGQLAEGGRLVTVIGTGRHGGRAMLGQQLGGAFTLTPAFDCATAALPAFAHAPGFVF